MWCEPVMRIPGLRLTFLDPAGSALIRLRREACRREPDGPGFSSMWTQPRLSGGSGLLTMTLAISTLWGEEWLTAAGNSLTKLAGGSGVSIAPCCGRYGALTNTLPISRCDGWAGS